MEVAAMTPHTLPAHLARVLPIHSSIGPDGELVVGGCSVPELAREFGTPLYAIDEQGLRDTMRRYREGLSSRWARSRVCFASKSLPCVAAYAVAQQEGLLVDVVGEGELRLALAAGVEPGRLVLHGNAKSEAELRLAKSVGAGLVVVDNPTDIEMLSEIEGGRQDVLLRVLPEIDANTHPSIATGGRGSKFGLTLAQTRETVERLRDHPRIRVRGVHVHIGSQILETAPFVEALRVVAGLGAFDIYNVGGGLGVNYSDDDDAPTIEQYLDAVTAAAREALPATAELLIEPGRSLVSRSGVTLYGVRNVKRSNSTFVAVDGGMSDQINIALTDDRFTAVIAERVAETPDTIAQVVGRQCESGDLLVDRAPLPAPRRGDTVAIAGTGAYGFTFVNNYNGALHPPMVFCLRGEPSVVVRGQSYEDLIAPHAPALEWTRRRPAEDGARRGP
ncbi:diaminopimelate decarboxylase [Leucobacter muris]|uniref:Diaminopimelate decarboxylase n=2 Tax=Leucobacter muris TaxID=1935379 RepID=A0ABX5QC81_9MICO|nr:diaminopimelate decarboxylase [Leucobacter muris]